MAGVIPKISGKNVLGPSHVDSNIETDFSQNACNDIFFHELFMLAHFLETIINISISADRNVSLNSVRFLKLETDLHLCISFCAHLYR